MANTYLNRTPSSSGSNTTWTYSCWYKKTSVGLDSVPWATGYTSPQIDESMINIGADDQLRFNIAINDATDVTVKSSRKLRDVSAWYHIVVACDTTQGTASNRIKFYINGEQETSFTNSDYPTQGQSTFFGDTNKTQLIGRQPRSSNYLEGNMSHVAFVDGAALAPTVFGETDTASGIWKWKEITGVTWGTNGFHLKFENSGNLGLDSSGNSNTFTVNGSATRNIDNPSINYARLNLLNRRITSNAPTYSNTNTSLQGQTVNGQNNNVIATFGDLKSGKWYFEVKVGTAGDTWGIGVADNPQGTNGNAEGTNYNVYYQLDGQKYVGASASGSSYGASFTTGNIIGCAFDLDNGTIIFYKDGATQGTADTGLITNMVDGYTPMGFTNKGLMHWNFGDGYFGTTAISSAGSNGNGSLFEYDVPSGYYALNTKNINTYG
jgi:hypothetical protein